VIGVILAGGKNQRMGTEKAFLDFNGETFLHRQIRIMSPCCTEIAIVCNDPQRFGEAVISFPNVRIICDLTPHKGPLSGIQTALHNYPEAPAIWIVSCDSPFIDPNVAISMQERLDKPHLSLAVPVVDNTPQLLHAIYRPSSVLWIDQQFNQGNYKLMDILTKIPHVKAEYPMDSQFVLDVDTPEEYEQLIRKGGPM
jgi:molybdopterin-guanine dinucleotide biosynthesis protein A